MTLRAFVALLVNLSVAVWSHPVSPEFRVQFVVPLMLQLWPEQGEVWLLFQTVYVGACYVAWQCTVAGS